MPFPTNLKSLAAVATLTGLTACAGSSMMFAPDSVPAAVQVPAGHRIALETTGIGKVTYECQAQDAGQGRMQFLWVLVKPDAQLNDRSGRLIGKYFGPPATWAALDGSSVSGTQVATAPSDTGIALQLVKANPSTGNGAMTDVTYVQRVATKGGVVPGNTCNPDSEGTKADVQYQADYIFWKAR